MEAFARIGQFHRAMDAVEERHAQLFLQVAHRIGDGSLRHAKLVGGAGKILVASGGLEDDEAGGGGEQAAQRFHKLSL
jgi:hypothetical protein